MNPATNSPQLATMRAWPPRVTVCQGEPLKILLREVIDWDARSKAAKQKIIVEKKSGFSQASLGSPTASFLFGPFRLSSFWIVKSSHAFL